MTTTVPLLTSTVQFDDVFQLGTADTPCTVVFGMGDFDTENKWRAAKVAPPAATVAVLRSIITVNETKRGEQMITVKVSEDTVITNSDGEAIDELERGMECMVVVNPYLWKMKLPMEEGGDREGFSLQALAVRVVGHKKREHVTYDFV